MNKGIGTPVWNSFHRVFGFPLDSLFYRNPRNCLFTQNLRLSIGGGTSWHAVR